MIEAGQMRSGYPLSLHADFAMISDRPIILHLNAGGRLHSENGPAIAWREEWGLYAWHGYVLPRSHEWLIANKGQITPDKIEAEANAEHRRIALEIFGFDRYLENRKARVLAKDDLHGQPRRLLSCKVGGETIRILEVINGSEEPDGTRRKFHLGTMPGKTPHECVAVSFGRPASRYREIVGT